jgi:hypothetical protein
MALCSTSSFKPGGDANAAKGFFRRLLKGLQYVVATDGCIHPEKVVVDGGCDADHVNPKLAEHVRARQRSVAASHHHTIDAPLGEKRLGPATLLAEFRASGIAEKGARDLNVPAHAARMELSELTVDQALPTLAHSVNCHALIECAARDRIHAGGITTNRK